MGPIALYGASAPCVGVTPVTPDQKVKASSCCTAWSIRTMPIRLRCMQPTLWREQGVGG